MRAVAAPGPALWGLLAAALVVVSCDPRQAGSPAEVGEGPAPEAETVRDREGLFRIRPRLGPDLRVRLDGILNRLHVDLPENLWSSSPDFTFAPVLGRPARARLLPNGYQARTASARVQARWELRDDVAELALTVRNEGDAPARDLRGNVCLHLHHAPTFQPEAARGVFIFQDGAPLEFAELAGRDGYLASRVRVRARDGEGEGVGRRNSSPLFSVSRQLADDGVIVATSADGRWTLGTLWQDAQVVFHNMLSGSQCIHSNASFGDLAPGGEVTRRGWLVLVEGGPRETHRRLLALRRAAESGG